MRGNHFARPARFCAETLTALGFAALFLLLLERDAQAYLDPGSMSFVIQGIVGAVLGAAIYVKLQWKRIKLALNKLFGRYREEETG